MSGWRDSLPELLNEQTPQAMEVLLARAGVVAENTLEGEERDLVIEGLARVSMETEAIGHLTSAALSSVIALASTGSETEARARFVQGPLLTDFERTRALSHASTAETIKVRMQREADWDAMKVLLKDLGKIALKLLPLLLAAA